MVEIRIAPEIKKIIYFNMKQKLKEFKEKRNERMIEKNENLLISKKTNNEIEHEKNRGNLPNKKKFQLIEKKDAL